MTTITVTRTVFGEPQERTFEDPDFFQVLCNTNQVAVDGETLTNVTEVTYDDD